MPAGERQRDWPPQQRERLLRLLPQRTKTRRLRYDSCAVVGSSPELLLYEDGAAIDAHAAVFRANRAKVAGWEKHVGSRTTVRVVNPVEDVYGARKLDGGDKGTVIIKNTDPPSIRSPGKEHGKFMGQAEKAGQADIHTNYIGRREALERAISSSSCRGSKLDMPASKRGKAKQLKHGLDVNATLAAFRRFAAEGEGSWHPMGDAIPRFSDGALLDRDRGPRAGAPPLQEDAALRLPRARARRRAASRPDWARTTTGTRPTRTRRGSTT